MHKLRTIFSNNITEHVANVLIKAQALYGYEKLLTILFEGISYDQILDRVIHSDVVPIYRRAADAVVEKYL